VSPLNQLSWDNFRNTVFLRGQQRIHRVSDSPRVDIFADGVANRIGIWLDITAGATLPPELSALALITARTVCREGRDLLEVSTDTPSIQRQFYHFALAVAERLTVEHRPATEAVAMELQCFADLLAEKPLLGIERQIGLLGELLLLERLVDAGGPDILNSWVGPAGEPHDFRTQQREFEVKTTVSTRRVHTIHGTDQMLPSPACSLFLISVLLGPSGAAKGFSLTSKVSELTQRLGASPAHLIKFTDAVGTCGYRESDKAHYSRAFILRRPLAVVPVDSAFPAITRNAIQTALGSLASRVESIQYDVDVEGLEHEDGTPVFNAVFVV
jgi:hypothetical protein